MKNRFLMLARVEEKLTYLFRDQKRASSMVTKVLTEHWGLHYSEVVQEMLKEHNLKVSDVVLFAFAISCFEEKDAYDPKRHKGEEPLVYLGLSNMWFNWNLPGFTPLVRHLHVAMGLKYLGVSSDAYDIFALDCSDLNNVYNIQPQGHAVIYRMLILSEVENVLTRVNGGENKAFFAIKRALSNRSRFVMADDNYRDSFCFLVYFGDEKRGYREALIRNPVDRKEYVRHNPISAFWFDETFYEVSKSDRWMITDFMSTAKVSYITDQNNYLVYRVKFNDLIV